MGGGHYVHPLQVQFVSAGGVGRILPVRDGWALGRTLEPELALSAFMALQQRKPQPAQVHHSDRGVQYASQEYTGLLKEHKPQISMSRKGNPYDNVASESFLKTLKCEELYPNEYRDFNEARTSIQDFLERVCNQKQLHSALRYLPSPGFESSAA
jgi:transposase InsO family protein